MSFFKILESEINSIVQIVTGSNTPAQSSKITEEENEKLQGMLSNAKKAEPLTDVTQKRIVSPRVNEKEVQDAIAYFNTLSEEEKGEVLEKVDEKLQKKLMAFMDANAKYTEHTEGTNYLMRQLSEKATASADRKSYTDKEMAVLVKDFQRLFANCNIEAERVMNAFLEYRGNESLNCGKICENNKDEFAINLCSRFKQAMNSYNQVFISNVQEILKSSESSKPDFMNNLTRTIEKIQSEIEHFQNRSRELMNAFIPDVVNEDNKFSKDMAKYVNNGIPADLYLPNKVVENTLIDTIVEESKKSAVSNAA